MKSNHSGATAMPLLHDRTGLSNNCLGFPLTRLRVVFKAKRRVRITNFVSIANRGIWPTFKKATRSKDSLAFMARFGIIKLLRLTFDLLMALIRILPCLCLAVPWCYITQNAISWYLWYCSRSGCYWYRQFIRRRNAPGTMNSSLRI